MQTIKKFFMPVLFGIIIATTAYLGFVFFKMIETVNWTYRKVQALDAWACSKDPASCVDEKGNPVKVPTQENTAPTTTQEVPAPQRNGQPNTQ